MIGGEEEGKNRTATIILAILLVLALAVVAILLISNLNGNDSGSGEEIFQPTAAPEEPVNLPLEGTPWYLSGVAEGTSISLAFSGDSISGFSGCNNYSATYRSTRAGGSSNKISVDSISSGQAMCDEAIMNQEQAFFANLQTTSGYTISGNTLTLDTGGGSLTFGAPQATQ